MKKQFLIIVLTVFSFFELNAQFYNLSVIGGYGSGNYHVGDTVHVWSEAYDSTRTFLHWSGDTQFVVRPNEWHSTVIMPSQNISITSNIANIPSYTIGYEQIMGANNLKNVYYCFPSNLKGIIYLFHGTGGSASNWINTVEYRSFVNAAIADRYGIIVTEAEEISLNTDLNGDGKLRWQGFPIDTVNGIDYRNIKVLTDTFVNRGDFTHLTPKYSVGMSNGGSFSAAISYAYHYLAGVSYCASSIQAIFNVRNNPFAFRMAKYDDNVEVGSEGNYEAWQYDSILQARALCHDYQLQDRQPIYPERFARIPGISIASSQAIFNDLLINNQLNVEHYALHSDSIKSHVIAHPTLYPNVIALNGSQSLEVINQVAASNAEHKFYSDLNFETIDFLNKLCSTPSANNNDCELQTLIIYPNPSSGILNVKLEHGFYANSNMIISDITGKIVCSSVVNIDNHKNLIQLNLSNLKPGCYNLLVINNLHVSNRAFFVKY